MPHSLILNLLPQSTIYPQFLTGRHYHALFLNLVSSVDRTLGDLLHESTADKAFTLSPLQVKLDSPKYTDRKYTDRKYTDRKYIDKRRSHVLQYQQQRPINPGTPCWWRISLLDDTLFSKLTQLWLNINPEQPWHLGSADLFITSIQGTPQSIQPWANACSYSQLYDRASNIEKTINFVFATPTAFRQGSYDTGLPTRELVFRSLLKRWNKYSQIEFDSEFIESIYPSFFNIKTEIASDSRSKFIGCVGEISYRIMGELEAETIKKINALADFALYAGVGRKTPMGMGMVRRI